MADSEYYPIVLVRGFAFSDKDIETAANQAFLGFEQGFTGEDPRSSKAQGERIDYASWFFESVVMRLQADHGYVDSYVENSWADASDGLGARSIWPFRYYDLASEAFGAGSRLHISEYAKRLRSFILHIREATCRSDAEKAGFKVNLVTHSQGGLVARTYLQNVCAGGDIELTDEERAALELDATGGDPLVNRVFNYGTPHRGIEVLGNNNLLDPFGDMIRADVFDRGVMRKYLNIPDGQEVNSLAGAFPPEDVFNLIGSDWKSYDIWVSKMATRKRSDGLVKQKNAWTQGSPRATVHKAHGGPSGLVNSQEGYENLQRFLFGDWRVDIKLHIEDYNPPVPFEGLRFGAAGELDDAVVLADAELNIRGGDVPLHQRLQAHESAIGLIDRHLNAPNAPVHIASTFLKQGYTPSADDALRFNLELDIRVSASRRTGAFRRQKIRNQRMLALSLIFDLAVQNDDPVQLACFDSAGSGGAWETAERRVEGEAVVFTLPVGASGDTLEPGQIRGALSLTVSRHG